MYICTLQISTVLAVTVLYLLKFHEMKTGNAMNNYQAWNITPKRIEQRDNLMNKSNETKRKGTTFSTPNSHHNSYLSFFLPQEKVKTEIITLTWKLIAPLNTNRLQSKGAKWDTVSIFPIIHIMPVNFEKYLV